jgi:hypothetical protein
VVVGHRLGCHAAGLAEAPHSVNNRTDPEIEQGSSLLPGQTTLNLRHCTLS